MDNNNDIAEKIESSHGAEGNSANAELVTVGTVKSKASHGSTHDVVTYNPKMPEPQMINGIKVYPTSYIPAKAELHLPKKMLVELQEWHIEGIHIMIFFVITIALFIGMWKRPNLR